MARTRRKGADVLYFSMDPDNATLVRHLAGQGRGAYLKEGQIVLADGKCRLALVEAAAMPVAMNGHARFNIANALAVSAGMLAAGFTAQQIAACLTSFVSDSRTNPLRANRFDVHGVIVIVDCAHNPGAYAALGGMARSMAPRQTVAVVAAPGDRRDDDLREIGATCAPATVGCASYIRSMARCSAGWRSARRATC
jgi:cyanophycin synthetase